jgi:hypothetical protein
LSVQVIIHLSRLHEIECRCPTACGRVKTGRQRLAGFSCFAERQPVSHAESESLFSLSLTILPLISPIRTILLFLNTFPISFFPLFSIVSNHSLSESGHLPSAGGFAGYFLSGTRQSLALGKELIYQVQDTQHSQALGKDCFAESQTLGKDDSRQRAVSGRLQLTAVSLYRGPKAGTRQSLLFAECQISGTRQRESLPSVFCGHSAKHIFIFFILVTKLFVVCSYTM